jgi:hypothetical protein
MLLALLCGAQIVCAVACRRGADGAAVWVDGQVAWRADAATPARDGRRWRLYGDIVRDSDRWVTTRIEVESATGERLDLARPAREHPGLEPVLTVGSGGTLRFVMARTGRRVSSAQQDGAELALDDVVRVQVTRNAAARARSGAPDPGFALRIGQRRAHLTLDGVAELVDADRVDDVPGDAWSLRSLVRALAPDADVQGVTITGAHGDRYRIEADEWRSERILVLRRNARGLAKFEALRDGARRRGVPDVTLVDVATN